MVRGKEISKLLRAGGLSLEEAGNLRYGAGSGLVLSKAWAVADWDHDACAIMDMVRLGQKRRYREMDTRSRA